jgi:hypothetical protein
MKKTNDVCNKYMKPKGFGKSINSSDESVHVINGLKYRILNEKQSLKLFKPKTSDNKYCLFFMKDNICHGYDRTIDKFVPNRLSSRYPEFKVVMDAAEADLKDTLEGLWIYYDGYMFKSGWYRSITISNFFRLAGVTP